MVVAAGQECHAGGRAQRGGMHAVVAQATLCQAVQVGGVDGFGSTGFTGLTLPQVITPRRKIIIVNSLKRVVYFRVVKGMVDLLQEEIKIK